MKGFALDGQGDTIIERDDVKLAYGTDLLAQKIRQVLSTNRGEWWLDLKEGIPVRKVLKKDPDLALARDYVRSAVAQVDRSLRMTSCDIAMEGRLLKISFSVASGTGDVELEVRQWY